MPYRIPHRAITAVLGGAFLLVAQTSFRSVGQVQASGPTTGDARLLVQEEARAVQSIDHFVVAHQVDITSVTPHYNQTTHAYVKTWVQRPGHVRAESQQYTRSEMIVSDGSTTWIYDGGHRIYWRQSRGAPAALFSNAFPGLARQLSSANLPAVITSARLVGKESLTITGRSYPCNIVDVSVIPSAAETMLQDNLLRLWISQKYKVPLKVEATFVGAAPPDHKKYSDYVTDFEPDINIPASVWTFKPPPDAKQRSDN
jgi:outer membrane lipoprotein-sorting protein